MGFTGTVEEFRAAPAEVKAEAFPGITDEKLTYTRDEAGTYCSLVRRRLDAPRLARVSILRNQVGLRKHVRRGDHSPEFARLNIPGPRALEWT